MAREFVAQEFVAQEFVAGASRKLAYRTEQMGKFGRILYVPYLPIG